MNKDKLIDQLNRNKTRRFYIKIIAVIILVAYLLLGIVSFIKQSKSTSGKYRILTDRSHYYTNDYVDDGSCIKFVEIGYSDTSKVCGQFTIEVNN